MGCRILTGDCRLILPTLEPGTFDCCATSPPYWGLRNYGDEPNQIGLEPTHLDYIATLVAVFREVHRVLKPGGTLWLNLGDCYAGSWGAQSREHAGKHAPNVSAISANQVKASQCRSRETRAGTLERTPGLKNKDLVGIPWRVAFALQADGWHLRQDIIWHKPNPMPESVTDRCTKAHEYIFLFSKSKRYHYDAAAIKEPANDPGRENGRDGRNESPGARPPGTSPRTLARKDYREKGRNKRSVWTVPPKGYKGAHFATFPPELIRPCILAGCPKGGHVLDPFGGSGTTGQVAIEEGRSATLIELHTPYTEIARGRIANAHPGLAIQ